MEPWVVAEAWAGEANAHMGIPAWATCSGAIIEANASIDRLAIFKSSYYDHDDAIAKHPPKIIGIASSVVELLLLAVFYHAM